MLAALVGPAAALAADEKTEQRLKAIEEAQEEARGQAERLGAEAERLEAEGLALSEELARTAATVREAERELNALDREIAELEPREAELTRSLEARRRELAHSLSALLGIARLPPLAAVARPGGAAKAGLTASALAGLTPELQAEARRLGDDIARLGDLRRRLSAARAETDAGLERLEAHRERLSALMLEKREVAGATRAAAAAEAARQARLAREADSLTALLERLDPLLEPVAVPKHRVAPEPLARMKGRLPLPAEGRLVRRFGEHRRGAPSEAQGLTLATRPGALVTAPHDGTVRFAGPFRSYGQLLIIDLSDGYHLLIAGLATTDVAVGQWLLAGEPIGAMESTGDGNLPKLYLELRHDGLPVDPLPWLAQSEGKISG